MDPDLIEAVTVQVEPLRGERLTAPQLALRQGEVVPDRVPQMRQVEPPEHTVPVGVVALRAADGPAGRRRAAATTPSCRPPAPRSEGLHLLTHSVGLGVAHEEVPPVRPAPQP